MTDNILYGFHYLFCLFKHKHLYKKAPEYMRRNKNKIVKIKKGESNKKRTKMDRN